MFSVELGCFFSKAVLVEGGCKEGERAFMVSVSPTWSGKDLGEEDEVFPGCFMRPGVGVFEIIVTKGVWSFTG